jgi:hypothetical protein
MQIIIVFILFVAGLDAIAIGICTYIERYSEYASLLAFLGLFVVNFVIAWQLAVYVTERYLVSDAQREKDAEHVKWVKSLVPARQKR